MLMNKFTTMNSKTCSCGKIHSHSIKEILIGSGVINQLPSLLADYKKAFILCDINTIEAAGNKICNILDNAGVLYTCYVINEKTPEPYERSVGSVIMHYDTTCDVIISVGSGVLNDIGKILANVTNNPYIIVATAPSMDGYASKTSSMTRDGLKISLPSKNADYIIGDSDILCKAPIKMLASGLGDMIAKYVSICEWKLSNIITGEYYCDEIAQLVKGSLKKCVDNADGLMNREPQAVLAVFEGLVICGAAMTYAGLSRPASGCEHYLSHIWDMRSVEFNTNVDFHGVQCAIGTLIISRLYEQLKGYTPDKIKAMNYANSFDVDKWYDVLKEFLGSGADSMIELDKKEQKYNIKAHEERLDIIISNWNTILKIIDEEIPSSNDIFKLLKKLNLPVTTEEIGIPSELVPLTFKTSKDIRDKYVLSRLAWDLGIIDELKY